MHTDNDDIHRYDDIINLEHHISSVHKRMRRADRAVQFAPFAALTGYDAVINETARVTDKKSEPDEDVSAMIDMRLQILYDNAASRPKISVTYFKPDDKKTGGEYVTISGNFRRISEGERMIVMTDGRNIPVDDIFIIEGDVFNTPDIF
ncbi:MAG: hypothetical protein Q4F95_15645 [Oscillospiraceae bacterium]|nr:hypothetical protein [Oscillospiraceae bacterium]